MARSRAKIAFILPNLHAGGAERVMITIANHLDKSRFEPTIIAFNKEGPLEDLIAKDIPIISLGVNRIRQAYISFICAIQKESPDIIFSTMAHLNFLVLMTSPFLSKRPIIVREAITPDFFADNRTKKTILNIGYKFLYPMAAKIISPTQLVFEQMPKTTTKYRKKLKRIFNPVNIDVMKEDIDLNLRSSLGMEGKKLFIAAGRLVHQKGFDRLIESLKDWSERNDWQLIILGDGPDRESLQQLIDKNSLKQISLAGFESRPWRYYAIADAFLLPSRHEGLPNVALEALAMGAPVIAMNSAGGIAEIASEAESQNVRIAKSMDEFVRFMDGAKMRVCMGASLLPPCFSLPEVVKDYEDVFDEVLANPS